MIYICIHKKKKKRKENSNWPKKPYNLISQSLFHSNLYTYNTSFQKINFQKKRTIRNISKNISCVSISVFFTTSLPVHRKFLLTVKRKIRVILIFLFRHFISLKNKFSKTFQNISSAPRFLHLSDISLFTGNSSAESWPRNFISRHWGSIPPLRSTRLKTDGRWHLAESSVTQRRIEWKSPIDSTRNG